MDDTATEDPKQERWAYETKAEEGGWSVVGDIDWHKDLFDPGELETAVAFLAEGSRRVLVVACPDGDVGAAAFATLRERLGREGTLRQPALRLFRGFDLHAISRALRTNEPRLWLLDGCGAHAASLDEEEVLGRASLWAELRSLVAWTDLLEATGNGSRLVVLLPQVPELPTNKFIRAVTVDPVRARLRLWFREGDPAKVEADLSLRHPDRAALYRRLRQLGSPEEVKAELARPLEQAPAGTPPRELSDPLERAVLFVGSMLRVGEDPTAPPLHHEAFDRAVTIVIGEDTERIGERDEPQLTRWRADRGAILARAGLVHRWFEGAEPRDRALRVAFQRADAREATARWLQTRDPTEVATWTRRLLDAGALSRSHGELCIATMLHVVDRVRAEPVWTGEPLLGEILRETIPGTWETVASLLRRLGAEEETRRTAENALRRLPADILPRRRPSLLGLGLNSPYALLDIVAPLLSQADPGVRGEAQRLVWDLMTTLGGLGALPKLLRWFAEDSSEPMQYTATEVFVQILEHSVAGGETGPLQRHLEAIPSPEEVIPFLLDPRIVRRAAERVPLHFLLTHAWLVPPRSREALAPETLAAIEPEIRDRLLGRRDWMAGHTLPALTLAELACRYLPQDAARWSEPLRLRGRLDRGAAISLRGFLATLLGALLAARGKLGRDRSPAAVALHAALVSRERCINLLRHNLQA